MGRPRGRSDGLLRELEDPKTVRGRVEAVLLPLFHTGAVGTDAVARTLGVSRQTLFRKLNTEDVTRKQVLDALRRRRALRDLTGAKTSVNETAYRLSFPRASKRWTGMSPREAQPARVAAPGALLPCGEAPPNISMGPEQTFFGHRLACRTLMSP